jgi:uncharacterized protein
MKNILVIGGSGRVGSQLIEYLIEENFSVRTILRTKNEILEKYSNLEIIYDDVSKPKKADSWFLGIDAVYSCLSGRKTKPDYSILTKGVSLILNHSICNRLILIGGAGILHDEEFGFRRNRPGYPEIFKLVSSENLKVWKELENSNKEWSFLCAPEMPSGERTKKYRLKKNFLPENGNRISVEDVADAMLKILEEEWSFRSRIGISY